MYGNSPFTPEEIKSNEELISAAIQKSGSREEAAKRAIKIGWQYYFYKNDPKTAMKRFNQAWLLDPSNAEVYYGFGFLMAVQRKTSEAAYFYGKTLEINPNHSMALANLGWTYKDRAYALYIKKRIAGPDAEVKAILREALLLYKKAIQLGVDSGSDLRLSDIDRDLRYIYYEWAITLEFNGEYAKAWEKIKLSRQHGGDIIIEPAFIKELSHFMPEPKG